MTIDRTFGKGELISVSKKQYEMATNEMKAFYDHMVDVFVMDYKNWFITKLMCQYQKYRRVSIYDAMWYHKIIQMLEAGELYWTFIPLENYAFADVEHGKNKMNLENTGIIKVDLDDHVNSDGFFSMEKSPIELWRVEHSSFTYPSEGETIYMDKIAGRIEIGQQSISKTAQTLFMGDNLLRVPYYQSKDLPPLAAIFVNINPKII